MGVSAICVSPRVVTRKTYAVSGIKRVTTRGDTQNWGQSGMVRVTTRGDTQNLRPVWVLRGTTRGDTPKLTPSLAWWTPQISKFWCGHQARLGVSLVAIFHEGHNLAFVGLARGVSPIYFFSFLPISFPHFLPIFFHFIFPHFLPPPIFSPFFIFLHFSKFSSLNKNKKLLLKCLLNNRDVSIRAF